MADLHARTQAADAAAEAARANQRIDDHEDRCAERWREARKRLDALHGRWWWLMVTLVGGLGAIFVQNFLIP